VFRHAITQNPLVVRQDVKSEALEKQVRASLGTLVLVGPKPSDLRREGEREREKEGEGEREREKERER
jgi:hypothetical protein